MRQAGVLAGAAMYALNNHVERLKEDHDNTIILAKFIYENGGPIAFVDMGKVHTNILFVNFNNILAVEVVKRLAKVTEKEKLALGRSIIVKVDAYSKSEVRCVCHLNVSKEDIELVTIKLKYVLDELKLK
ncbi:hypothetical protein EB796_010267 [Bugula neritina]|uniref:Aromatic amino acid beta-eliminating lyase/threonine aldolase domain-containing protein n=1 Tax=Bugula neritina TaxID=10212 RepID=A0A7J7K0E6_BUGNE|nr:hypothetical protein EB796_010267 [Bugula neritina]